MTIAGPPTANAENDISLTEELWMEDEPTEQEETERRNRIAALLKNNPRPASHSAVAKTFENNAGKHWDRFYQRNGNRFFKDRHYLGSEFPVLKEAGTVFIECGCGVGNAILPLLDCNPSITVIGGDFAKTAVETMRRDERYCAAQSESVCEGRVGRAFSEVWDITVSPFPGEFRTPSGESKPFGSEFADAASLIFCLSAIPPQKHERAIRHVASCIKAGGQLLFRDYAENDDAQLNLLPGCLKETGRVITDRTLVKQDGTICHYFAGEAEVRGLFEAAGFQVQSLQLIKRQYQNRADGTVRRRRWLTGVFTKR